MIQSCSFQGEDHRRENKLYGFSGWVHHHHQDNKATINRIMLKFRPIAPKPANNGFSTAMKTANDMPKKRTKRKYVRAKKTNKPAEKPMKTDRSFGLSLGLGLGLELGFDKAAAPVVESWVVVKAVTVAGGLLGGGSDEEKMMSLEADTCPGFVTDGLYEVRWVNPSYKRMVVVDGGGAVPVAEVAVRLVVEEDIPVGCSAFACTARVVYTWRKEKYTKTMPCDVWRMDFGGFAWRLDAKAALCLGR